MSDQLVTVSLTVNGTRHELELPARRLLSDALRHDLRLTGTHVGCEHGVCGACTVLVDGAPTRSCLVFAVSLEGAEITTVTAYLEENPSPTAEEAREAISGNLCRCTGYQNIVAAVLRGSDLLAGRAGERAEETAATGDGA
jgi:carbon-monoxide dehydrogenase small subunit